MTFKPYSSPKSIDLLLSFEGVDQPWLWPGGSSGVTLGRGYDLGYEKTFCSDWSWWFDVATLKRLAAAVAVTGEAARKLAPSFRDIHVSLEAANDVFHNVTLPREEGRCRLTFPNSDKLPADAFGALVSLGYNRGWSLHGKRRQEMGAIAEILAEPLDGDTLDRIAAEVESMARYWPDNEKSDRDLHDRRWAEAKLIREAQWPRAEAV